MVAFNVEEETFRKFRHLYRWHTNELARLEQRWLETNDADQRNRIEQVQRTLIDERARIRRMYPNRFQEDIFDAKF